MSTFFLAKAVVVSKPSPFHFARPPSITDTFFMAKKLNKEEKETETRFLITLRK